MAAVDPRFPRPGSARVLLRRAGPPLRWLRHRHVPWMVSWMLTERCNASCAHCACWIQPAGEMSQERALSYAHEMVQLGVLAVSLCGGEVLLRPDLGTILQVFHDAGVRTRITSNGQLVTQRIDDLRHLDLLKLSLDGPVDLQERIRGPGTYQAVMDALDASRRVGLPVQLNTVLWAPTLERLDEHLALARSLDVPVTFNPPEQRHDDVASTVNALSPTPGQLTAGIRQLAELSRRGDRVVANSKGTLDALAAWPDLQPVQCHAGSRFCRVLADGRVVTCDRLAPPAAPGPVPDGPGFGQQLMDLQKVGACHGCWRNNTMEINRALEGARDALRALAGWGRRS